MTRKNILKWSLLMLLLMPIIVLAEEEEDSLAFFAFIWVAFASIHWTFAILMPLAKMISPDNYKQTYIVLFAIRAVILIIAIPIFNFAFLIDFFALFIGAFILSMISSYKEFKNPVSTPARITTPQIVTTPQGVLVCPKCGRKMAFGNTKCVVCGTSLDTANILCPKCNQPNQSNAKFCASCGESLSAGTLTVTSIGPILCPKCKKEVKPGEKFCGACGENVEKVVEEASKTVQSIEKAFEGTPFDKSSYNPAFFLLSEDTAINNIIKKEINENPDSKGKSLPSIEKKKLIGTIIYAIICFILVSIYVSFHTYLAVGIIIWLVSTFVYFNITAGYSIEKFLQQEVKKRPDEKISYIVSSTLSGATSNKAIYVISKIIIMALWIVGSFVLYREPHMIYEKTSQGYSLRYYTYGLLKHEEKVVIPDTYKGEKVIGIRGDTFKNVRSIKEVIIPESVSEIRGGTFEGCTNLSKVTLPKKLVRIGGSAFKNCSSLVTIEIPETVTEIGGESFYDCTSLKEINLPSNLLEIRGDTFSGCTSLTRIEIPDTVTRIGGHAFYANSSLSEVGISKDSQLQEIGSSAFRLCNKLETIKLPYGVSINERAFKESPTQITYYSDTDTGNYEYVTSFNLYEIENYHWINSPKYGAEITIHYFPVMDEYDEVKYYSIDITGPFTFSDTISKDDNKKIVNEDMEIALIQSYYGGYELKVNYN